MATGRTPDLDHLLQHAAFVRAVARATLRGDDLVDDVVQETWIAALEKGSSRRGPLAPWLAGVARNQARNLLRRRAADRRREHVASRPEGVSPQQEVVDRLEIERRLMEAVESLPEHCRTPLVLRYLNGLPPRVIAVRLDLPVETVRTRVRRGLAQLRKRLEADHGDQAREWRLALLPLLEPNLSSPVPLVVASGGLLMAKKILLGILALVLLAGGLALFVPGFLRPSSPSLSESSRETQGHPRHQAPAPALVGRPGRARRDEGDVVEPASREDPVQSGGPSEAENGTESGDAMQALLADIRRDVAPEWWGGYPDLGTLEGRNGIVIARAPRDVLDAIMRYLDLRRKGDRLGVEDPPQGGSRALDAARAALRPVLRGILAREHRIGLAIEAWGEGHLAEARVLAEEVLAEESDNAFAKEIRAGVGLSEDGGDAAASAVESRERLRQRLESLRRQQTLHDWEMSWPSARTWRDLTSLRKQVDVPALHRLAPDLDELLDRGNVTIEVADASLYDAVRRLQIETFADIRLSKTAWDELARLPVVGFREEARSLRTILDELVQRLPEGWTWYAARTHVVIIRIDRETPPAPETSLRFFDMKDLHVLGDLPSETQSLVAPKTPPVYRSDPDGEPPVLVEDGESGERTPR